MTNVVLHTGKNLRQIATLAPESKLFLTGVYFSCTCSMLRVIN